MSTIYKPTHELLELPESERIRWAEALESGKYKQGGNAMLSNGAYCCLAVWESVCGTSDDEMIPENGLTYGHPSNMRIPAHMIGDEFPEGIRMAQDSGMSYKAVDLNDSMDFTFPEIAQILRGNTVEKS